MVDFAQRLLNVFSAAPAARADLSRRLAADYDANSDRQLDLAEFRRIFAEVQIDPAAIPEIGAGPSFGIRRTLFPEFLYPSFSRNYAQASYQAQAAIAGLDLDGDGAVSFAELDGTAKPPPQTPEARADALLARYDADGKGYIVEADLRAVWTADPSLGDPARAAQAIELFDIDADGKVTREEMLIGYSAMDKADAILAAFDPQNSGAIDIAAAQRQAPGAFADVVPKFSGWDYDGDGRLLRQEIIAGLQIEAHTSLPPDNNQPPVIDKDTDPALIAAMLLAQYDGNRDGSISAEEFASVAGGADFAAWDADSDQALTLAELQAGVAEIQQAQKIIADYDLAGKGWFDAIDLAAAIDPDSVDDVAARVEEIMSFWDADGDGKVSVAEVIRGIALGGYVGGEALRPGAEETSA